MAEPSFRILAADDNPANLKLIHRMLNRLNHHAETVRDGWEVLDALRRRPFDFVLLDVRMPRLDGLETARRIVSAVPPGERPVLLAMTASTMQADRDECLAAGMDDIIGKPILIGELERKLEHWAGQRASIALHERRSPHGQADHSADLASLHRRLEELWSLHPDAGEWARLLSVFVEQSEQRIQHLRLAAAEGRHTAAADIAHSLKGACLNFGAVHTADLCRELIRIIRERGGAADVQHYVESISASFLRMKLHATQWLKLQRI